MSLLPSNGIASTSYDTDSVPAKDRFESWQHRLTDVFRLSMPEDLPSTALVARTSVWKLDSVMLSPRTCSAHTLTRDERTVRRSQLDHYKLHVRLAGPGATRVDADGRRLTLGGGSFVVTDLARPEQMDADAGSTIALFLPRDALGGLLPANLDLHGVTSTAACSAMLVGHLQMLAKRLPHMRPEEVPHTSQAILRLVAASLAPGAPILTAQRAQPENAQRREICRYIDEHLSDEQMSSEELAARFRISRATLYRLFEPLGGVKCHIKERRLAHIHAVLLSGSSDLPLARLAESYGFRHATHFSRDFRQQFGYRPSELVASRSALAGRSGQQAPVFGHWLESMHR
jgi:AraC-like DNA-binding protein